MVYLFLLSQAEALGLSLASPDSPHLTVTVLQGQWTQEPGPVWALRQSLVTTALTLSTME